MTVFSVTPVATNTESLTFWSWFLPLEISGVCQLPVLTEHGRSLDFWRLVLPFGIPGSINPVLWILGVRNGRVSSVTPCLRHGVLDFLHAV